MGGGDCNMQLSDEELDAVVTLIGSLREFTKYSARLHPQSIKTLLLVAREEGKSVGEYAAPAGVSTALMSRYLLDLGEHNGGMGLVVTRRRHNELRKKDVFLTPEGREIVDRMVRYSRNDPEIVREYQERMARGQEEKKKVIELRNRYRTLEPGSAEWTEAFLKDNSKPEHIAANFGNTLRHLMRAFAAKSDHSTNLFEAVESWRYMSKLVERCEGPLSWYDVFDRALKGLRDDDGPENGYEDRELRDLDKAYREVARTGMSLYIDGMGEGGFGSVKHRRFIDALRHLEELSDRQRKERQREAALSTPAITWKGRGTHGDEVTFSIAPEAFTVMVMQVSDVRGGKVVKHRPRRTHGCSLAWAKLSQEDAIRLAEFIMAKYTSHKQESEPSVEACLL
jgi:DNA-binding MarR family transcriptional regulator